MAASPRFKVHNPQGEYIASCKHGEDAAALVALYGDGAKIKDSHTGIVVWKEGAEAFPAGESYDGVCNTMAERADAWIRKQRAVYEAKYGGRA